MFGRRRLQSNPPRSLWLQHIHWMCCLTRRAHTAVPPFEGTHGVRFAWGNTDAIDFVAIASSLRATNGRRAVGNTNRLKAVPLRFVRQLRIQTAQSLVLSVKLGAPFSRRLAARVPSTNKYIKPRYLDEERERHGLNQNPVYIGVHDFEASRA